MRIGVKSNPSFRLFIAATRELATVELVAAGWTRPGDDRQLPTPESNKKCTNQVYSLANHASRTGMMMLIFH